MGTRRSETLGQINFVCGDCRERFSVSPGRVVDEPDRPWHPYAYFAQCPACGGEAEQAHWEINLLKAHSAATGPKTPEGKAAVAQNLEGHPTPEEAKRTRFNAMKHGAFASTAQFFPAKPGKYPHCQTCEHFNNGCDEFPTRASPRPPACLKRTELFLKHHAAFETQDPNLLLRNRADTHAAMQAILDDVIYAIAAEGVLIKSPEWYWDKDGGFHLAQYTDPDTGERVTVEKMQENPLLKRLIDMISKNNLSLADMGMTPKVLDEHDIARGYIDSDKTDREDLKALGERQTKAMENLGDMIRRSQEKVKADPVYIEMEQQGDG